MQCEKVAKVKAELLYWGIKPTEETRKAYEEHNPLAGWKTGNIGLHIILDKTFVVMANTSEKFAEKSPYELKKEDNWKLYKKGQKLFNVEIIKMPKWYNLKTSTGRPMTDIFLHEGKHYLHQSYKGCGYFALGKECKFCGTGCDIKKYSPKEIAEVVKVALKENPKYHICLSGGTILGPDKGANTFTEEIKEIRKVTNAPLFVELAPPEEDIYLQNLIDAGANTISMNIEIWDDKIREKICPGKFKISKQRYLDAHEYVIKKLGRNKTSCVFVGGLEPIDSLLEGVEEFLKRGVAVEVMPFKPWKGSEFQNKERTGSEFTIEAGIEMAKLMKKYNIDKSKSDGCPNCGACAVEQDFLKVIE